MKTNKAFKAISVLLALIMLVALMPTSAFAVTKYDVWVGGTQITDENCSDVFGDGKVSFNAEDNKLTLNNYSYSGNGSYCSNMGGGKGYTAILIYGDINVEVIGENTVTSTNPNVRSAAVTVIGGNLKICGNGTLTANGAAVVRDQAYSYGILTTKVYDSTTSSYYGGSITVENAVLNANGGTVCTPTWDTEYNEWTVTDGNGRYSYSYGINAGSEIIFNNTEVTVTSGTGYNNSNALYSSGDIKITDSTVKSTAGWSYYNTTKAISASGTVSIDNSTVEATCLDTNADENGSSGIKASNCEISNGSEVTVTVGKCFENYAYGLNVAGLSFKDSTVGVTVSDGYYNAYGAYIDSIGAVIDNSTVNIGYDDVEKTCLGLYAHREDGNPAVEVKNGSVLNIESFNESGVNIRRGDFSVNGSQVNITASADAQTLENDLNGILINSPNYYNSSDGGNLVLDNHAKVTVECGDSPKNVYGVYVGSNMIYVTDSELNITTGSTVGDYQYGDSVGIDASDFFATNSTVNITTGDSNDDAKGFSVSQNSGHYVKFIGSKVNVNVGSGEYVHGIYVSTIGSPITVDGGAEITVTTGDSKYSNCGIDSYAGLIVDGASTIDVTTGDVEENTNYGIYAPDDYRGNFALNDGTITVNVGKGGTKSYGNCFGIYSYNDFIVGEKGVINATIAGGGANVNAAIVFGYPSPVDIKGEIHAFAGPVGVLDEGETPANENAPFSFGIMDEYPESHNPLVIDGFVEAHGYTKAIASGFYGQKNQNVVADAISVSSQYDGSHAENITSYNIDGKAVYSTIDDYQYFVTAATPCKVSFNANGGTGTMDSVNFDGVTEYTLPDCTFTAPAGLEFDCWDQGEIGDTITVSGDTVLTAQWWKGFPDVHRGDWFYDYVKVCAKAGIVKGYANGKFGPNDSLQRQDFVLILARLFDAPLDGYEDKACTLSDVQNGQYYSNAVKWAVDVGIINGYNNGKFGVGDKITREQIATIIYRIVRLDGFDGDISEYYDELDSFVDAGKVSAFARDGMAFCVHYKIITGKNGKYLAPTDNASRAEITAIIIRTFA